MLMDNMVEWEIERGLMDHDSLALVSKIKIQKMTCFTGKNSRQSICNIWSGHQKVDQCSLIMLYVLTIFVEDSSLQSLALSRTSSFPVKTSTMVQLHGRSCVFSGLGRVVLNRLDRRGSTAIWSPDMPRQWFRGTRPSDAISRHMPFDDFHCMIYMADSHWFNVPIAPTVHRIAALHRSLSSGRHDAI